MDNGYVIGTHAPGRRDWAEAVKVSLNLLRAHAAGVATFRAEATGQIGLVVNLVPVEPATDSTADRAAADRMDAYINRHFLDPALLGTFPPEMADMFGDAWPSLTTAEVSKLKTPTDFIGMNYYLRIVVRDDPEAGPARARVISPPDRKYTAMGWEIFPRGLTDTLLWLHERYDNVPLYVTENGAVYDDIPAPNGSINDVERVKYIREHLQAAGQALRAGVNLRGYFVWSLFDNFEWQHGYSKRFGIVGVDFTTQRRIPKASARFYSDAIRSGGANIEA
jgi:beta-glucosidase